MEAPSTAEISREFLTIKETAQILCCSQDNVRNRIQEGSLPAYRMGSRLIRIKKTDLEKLFHIIPSAVTK